MKFSSIYSIMFLLCVSFSSLEASIQYTDVNPDETRSTVGSTDYDIDGDGTDDITVTITGPLGNSASQSSIQGINGAMVAGAGTAQIFNGGATVDNSASYSTTAQVLCSNGLQPWCNNSSHHAGVSLLIGGQTHYAWVLMTPSSDSLNPTITVQGFAFENCPGEGIVGGTTTGGASCSAPAGIPTMSEWGLIILALLFMTMGTLYLVQPNFRRGFEQK